MSYVIMSKDEESAFPYSPSKVAPVVFAVCKYEAKKERLSNVDPGSEVLLAHILRKRPKHRGVRALSYKSVCFEHVNNIPHSRFAASGLGHIYQTLKYRSWQTTAR